MGTHRTFPAAAQHPHVSWVTYSYLRAEVERLTAAEAYWRALAHHWFLEARDVGRDPVARLLADVMLSEIHRRDIPPVTEEEAPWLNNLIETES